MDTHQEQISLIGDLDPMLSVLLEELPAPGSEWSRDARDQRIRIFGRALERIYKDQTERRPATPLRSALEREAQRNVL